MAAPQERIICLTYCIYIYIHTHINIQTHICMYVYNVSVDRAVFEAHEAALMVSFKYSDTVWRQPGLCLH